MGCTSSSDTSEFGRRRNEIEGEIDHLKRLSSLSKDAMNFKNPSKMQAGLQALESAQKVTISISEKTKSLKEYLATLKDEPDYAKKESQMNQTEKRFEKVGMEMATAAMSGAMNALGGLMK